MCQRRVCGWASQRQPGHWRKNRYFGPFRAVQPFGGDSGADWRGGCGRAGWQPAGCWCGVPAGGAGPGSKPRGTLAVLVATPCAWCAWGFGTTGCNSLQSLQRKGHAAKGHAAKRTPKAHTPSAATAAHSLVTHNAPWAWRSGRRPTPPQPPSPPSCPVPLPTRSTFDWRRAQLTLESGCEDPKLSPLRE